VDATEEDWQTEYLAPILSIKTVANIDEAMNHIEQYGSKHTDAIITNNQAHAARFLREVDSASVMVNASTRFADGFEYGLVLRLVFQMTSYMLAVQLAWMV